ncbi:MAG: T9SS type A sorting domain-containing protein [Bacteroidota bacterium]
MKRFLLSILFFVGVVFVGFGQTTFTSVQTGYWSDGTTWGNTGQVRGVDFPGPDDDVVILATHNITIYNDIDSANNLSIQASAEKALVSGGSFSKLTLYGKLIPFVESCDGPPCCSECSNLPTAPENSNIIEDNVEILFKGSGEVLQWSSSAPLGAVEFDLEANSASYNVIDSGDSLIFQSNFNLISGTLSDNTDISANIFTTGSTFNISTGATFNASSPIRNIGQPFESGARIPSANINGTLDLTQTTTFLNSENFNMGDGGLISINFAGTNQTQGWWYQSNEPATTNLDANSTVRYAANADQELAGITYGNLNFSAGATDRNKNVTGSGNFVVNGTFEIETGSVILTSDNTASNLVFNGDIINEGDFGTISNNAIRFNGGSAQSVSGTSEIDFNKNVIFDNASGVDFTEAVNFSGTTEILGSGAKPVFDDVTISNSLTQSIAEIDVKGDFINDGTYTHNNNLVRFAQAGTKNISGANPISFYDLAVEGGTVNVDGTVDLENTMTFAGTPTVDFDGTGSGVFTLKSTPTRDASIGDATGVTLNGNLNVERAVYTLRGDGKGYHMVGFPISGATVGEVQGSGFAITGTFTGASTTGTQGDGYASVFSYDQSVSGDFTNGYTAFPGSGGSTASEFEHGTGYFMFTYDGDAPGTISTTGTVFTGEFTKSLPYTANGNVPTEDEGWHLISNPYPSAINWDLVTTSNTESDAWLWNPNAGAWEALADGANATIPQGQAFFLRSLSGDGSITINEDDKVSDFKSFYKSPEPAQIFKVGLDNGSYVDYTYIGLKEGATFNYDGTDDASRLMNNNETISTMTADDKVVKVNRIPFQEGESCGNSIFINLEQMVNDKDYTLNFEGVENLSSKDIQLYDHYLDQTIDLNTTDSLQFSVNTDTASKGATRFELLINNKTPNTVAVETEDICPDENAMINLQQSDDFAEYLVYQGEEIVASADGTGSELSIEILNEFIADSSNDFEIKAFAVGCDTVSVGNASVQVNESLAFDNNVEGSTVCREEAQAYFSVATQVNASYFILSESDTIQSFQGNGNIYEGYIDSTELVDGLNEFTIAASKDGCQSGTLSQSLAIEVDNPVIDEAVSFTGSNTCLKTPTDISFVSQSGVDYQIFKGTTLVNSITGDGTEQSVEIADSYLSLGLNEFTVLAQNGECSEFEFPEPIQIEVEENINTNLSLITENTCRDASTSVLIENAQADKTYTLQSAGENISSLTAETDGELTFSLNSNQVSVGLNELDIQIEGEICGAELSTNQAVFNVNEAIDSNLEYLSANVCSAAEASIGVSNAQEGKIYRLYNGESLVESVTATADGELIFANANNELTQGLNTFNLEIEGDGCGLVQVEESLDVTLFESINPDLELLTSDVCTGDQVNIEITNPQAGKTYSLKGTDSTLATEIAGNEENITFSLASDQFEIGNHTLNIDISDDNCGTETANQTVDFELFDTAVIANIENQDICKDENITINLSSNVNMSNYQLYVGDELISEVTGSSMDLSPSETTTYTLTGTPESGCSVNTVNFTVEVTDLASPGILVSNNVLESSVEGDSYQWYLDGEILEDENGKILVAQEPGEYTVEVTKANCSQVSDAYAFSEEVLNANKALADAVNLYPNPVIDVLKIDTDNIKEIEITIYTLSGKFMDKENLSSSDEGAIDMSKFSKGTYLIQLKSGKGTITKRIIKQ